jgi:endonuclease YncB( thermonuclease family)
VPADVSEWCVPVNTATLGDVIRVVDGDTIEVSIGGQSFTVRYIGVEAPETGASAEPFAAEALGANLDLVEGQTVALVEDVTNADDSGQLPRYVMVDDQFINYELVRQGYAEAVPASPDTACDDLFALAAQYAQDEGLGMWGSGAGLPQTQATPGAQAQLQATSTFPAANWTPPPTQTATATSSLGFDCHCWGSNAVWGNFQNDAQGDACQAICEIQAARVAAACATAAASAGVAPGVYGCR